MKSYFKILIIAITCLAACNNWGFSTTPQAMIFINVVGHLKVVEMKEEIWKDVVGYEGLYQVSNIGRVKSNKKILNPKGDGRGYINIGLSIDKKRNFYKIHRLVALAFIRNNRFDMQINHINGIKTDNRVENLEWVTNSENQKHAIDTGLKIPYSIPVLQYDKKGNYISEYNSIKDASCYLNIKDSNISFVCKNKRKSAGGYIWRYKK